nr:T-cell surface antigen CD2-like [Misgurnus anguillicaudatus]
MSTKHHLTVLFFCGFNLLAVSAQICKKDLLEGQTCTLNLETKSGTFSKIEWIFTSGTKTLKAQRNKEMKTINNIPDATIESDGSLKLQNVKLDKNGKYRYEIYDDQGKKTAGIEKEIKVYAKVTKPKVKFTCVNGTAKLTCDVQMKDITITWIQGKTEKKEMKGEDKVDLIRTSTQIEQNADYSCRVHNPVSNEQSDVKTISCGGSFLGPGGKLFGIDFWIMIGILAGGGTLLLLLIVVLVVCACRSCNKQEKMQAEEEELRLRNFPSPSPSNQHRSKNTARGQPAPPIPQEDSSQNGPTTQTPPQTRAQPKAQVRARPPPPPQDEDEEDPPPLPQPRKKREKRHQEPYRPME